MQIILISDTHLGFAQGTERWEDAFLTFEEGVAKALDADLLILAGDVFDTRIPTTETFSRAMEILLDARKKPPLAFQGLNKNSPHQPVPVIAIHGNHERRVKGLVNPVEALEKGGFLTHLHCNGIIVEKDREKVAIQGISSVPEQYFENIIREWNPLPIPGCYNIFLFHQNLEGFLYSEKAISPSLLPRGFDLYICGDIHESHHSSLEGKPLILPGSTVATQLKKDSTSPRTFTRIDTKTGAIDFVPFENQRKIYYEECSSLAEAEELVRKILKEKHAIKPVIKIKSFFPPEDLEARFSDKALLNIVDQRSLPSVELEEQRLSAQESGKNLLRKNLGQAGLNPQLFEAVFELLLEKKDGEALSLLKAQYKNNLSPT